jgi:hypothetical protein
MDEDDNDSVGSTGWAGWGPDGPSPELPPEVHDRLAQRIAEGQAARGRLLALVQVYVYENGDAMPQVTFPPDCVLTPEDMDGAAEAVRLAREALVGWR